MAKLQLLEKQKQQVRNILEQKAKLNSLIQEINDREVKLLEIIFEAAGVTDPISSVQFTGDALEYEVSTKPAKKEKVKKEETPK